MKSEDRYAESIRRLESACEFPCAFQFKIIGSHENAFVERVVAVVRETLEMETDLCFSTRETPNGRHVSVTLEPYVATAADVIRTYDRLRSLEGVVLLL